MLQDVLKNLDNEFKENSKNPTVTALKNLYFKNKDFKAIIDGLNYSIIQELDAQVFLNETKEMLYGEKR